MKSEEKIKREIELLNRYRENIKKMNQINQIDDDDYRRSDNIVLGSIQALEWVLMKEEQE